MFIDGNSIAHAANAGTVLTVGQTQVQAVYGMVRSLRRLCAVYGERYHPVCLWDGASWRKLMYPEYKANRDKDDTAAALALKEQKEKLKSQTRMIEMAINLLGIDQVRAANMEADDLAGILVDRHVARGDKIVLVTADRDWIQLIGPTVTWFDPINDRKMMPSDLEEKYGVKTTKQFVELKALMGDMGDNISGVGGIGEKGAKEFLQTYESFINFSNKVLLEKTIDPKTLPKKYRDLIEDENKAIKFNLNIDLMDLRTKKRPAPINLTLTKGAASEDAFRAFCDKLMFRSITQDLDNWLSVFPAYAHIKEKLA